MQVLKTVRQAGEFGISTGDVSVDWRAVMARQRRIIKALVGDKQHSLEERGIGYFHRGAHFVAPTELQIDGDRVGASKIIIATGSRTARPPIDGIEHAITSDEALALEVLPRSVVMIGGGYIALEFSHIFHAFGVEVTILEMEPRILLQHDAEMALELQRLTEARGITLHVGTRVKQIAGERGRFTVVAKTPVGERRFPCDLVMNAAGREPNLDGLHLEASGVKQEKKRLPVNEYLQTSVGHIYAAGDVSSPYMLTPVASYEGKLAASNALSDKPEPTDYRVVPSAVFSDPELGAVGLTEEQAKEQGFDYQVATYAFAQLGSAILRGETDGLAKIISVRGSGHILGPEASELIVMAALAMQGNLTQQQLGETMLIHPSLSEALGALTTTAKTGHQEGCCG
jgi:pyruvate/2-oxoglutarate dehydrogenase complex dihydrolipoamide dehydrogenase (E3) component